MKLGRVILDLRGIAGFVQFADEPDFLSYKNRTLVLSIGFPMGGH